jgi:hypothetical protein
MLGFPIGILYSNAVEWVIHKYVLHGLGKRKGSFFGFHWKNHHRNARRNAMRDPGYDKPIWDWNSRGREAASILAVVAVHTPLVVVAPWFTAAVWYSGFNYLYKHQKCHQDIEWGKRHMRSHYDHHMGKDQDTNWCVTRPWFDWVMGTRVKYEYPEDKVTSAANGSALAEVALPNAALSSDAGIDQQSLSEFYGEDETSQVHTRTALQPELHSSPWPARDDEPPAATPYENEALPTPSSPPKAA